MIYIERIYLAIWYALDGFTYAKYTESGSVYLLSLIFNDEVHTKDPSIWDTLPFRAVGRPDMCTNNVSLLTEEGQLITLPETWTNVNETSWCQVN